MFWTSSMKLWVCMILDCLQGCTNNVYIVGDERVLVRITNNWWRKHLVLYHIEIIIDEVYAINCSSKSISSEQKCGKLRYVFNLKIVRPLRWRHNEGHGVSDHQPRDCLLNRLFRRRSKKTSNLRVTGLCFGNSPVNSLHKWPVTRKMFPFDDVIMLNRYQFELKCGKLWSSMGYMYMYGLFRWNPI